MSITTILFPIVAVLSVVCAAIAYAVHKEKIVIPKIAITSWILRKLSLNHVQLALISGALCATGLLIMLTIMYNGGTESTQSPYINYLVYALYLIGGVGLTTTIVHENTMVYDGDEMDEHDPDYIPPS